MRATAAARRRRQRETRRLLATSRALDRISELHRITRFSRRMASPAERLKWLLQFVSADLSLLPVATQRQVHQRLAHIAGGNEMDTGAGAGRKIMLRQRARPSLPAFSPAELVRAQAIARSHLTSFTVEGSLVELAAETGALRLYRLGDRIEVAFEAVALADALGVATMNTLNATGADRLKRCPLGSCGTLFIARRPNQEFCKRKHAVAAAKADWYARQPRKRTS